MEHHHLYRIFPRKMVIVHSYVSLPKGIWKIIQMFQTTNQQPLQTIDSDPSHTTAVQLQLLTFLKVVRLRTQTASSTPHSMDWFKGKLEGSPVFNRKIDRFRLRFSLQPVH